MVDEDKINRRNSLQIFDVPSNAKSNNYLNIKNNSKSAKSKFKSSKKLLKKQKFNIDSFTDISNTEPKPMLPKRLFKENETIESENSIENEKFNSDSLFLFNIEKSIKNIELKIDLTKENIIKYKKSKNLEINKKFLNFLNIFDENLKKINNINIDTILDKSQINMLKYKKDNASIKGMGIKI